MVRLSDSKIDKITQSCLDVFNKLPKTGKPVEKEWTVLSSIVKYDDISGEHEVVALGTGSKCIGASKMSSAGDVLNDSHAEVLARRGFLLYLYEMLKDSNPLIFVKDNHKYKLKDNIQFIFYSSQLPCGDASIIPKASEEEQFGDVLGSHKRQTGDICDIETKKLKSEIDDIHRTGAKCLPDSEQDPKDVGSNYHLLGQVRTKPGRGDRTLSVSCSDKMARWIHVGIHGSLLDMLLCEPIYIKHFIFGAGAPYSEESLKRALLNRDNRSSIMTANIPEFYQCSLSFPYLRTENNARPTAGSIVWAKTVNCISEVAVQGRKLGLTKKKTNTPNNSLCISKYKLYEKFLHLMHMNTILREELFHGKSVENIPYNEMKKMSKRYRELWLHIKHNFFKTWTKKPDMWDFCISNTK